MVEMTKEQYTNLCNIINKLSYVTPDVQIINSEVCQRSATNTYNIYADFKQLGIEIDNFGIIGLTVKFPLFKTLLDSTSDKFILDKQDNKYIVTDTISDIEITIPDFTNFTTRYDDKLKVDLNSYAFIASVELDKTLIKKLNNFTRILSADTINIDIKDKKLTVNIMSKSKTQTAKLCSVDVDSSNYSTTVDVECFKQSLGDSCTISLYKKSEMACIVEIKTNLYGCDVSYKQVRKGG